MNTNAPVMSALYVPEAPPRHAYSFANLRRFPRRLFYPPTSRAVAKVRSCSVTPYVDVDLKDVLDGKHLPPLSLKDFEEYILFVERSPENLHFIMWLREYTSKYEAWVAASEKDGGKQHSPLLLWTRAKRTFFDASSHLELNLPEDIKTSTLSLEPPPHPAALKLVRECVEGMLKESLMRFVCTTCRNSGILRGWFAISIGLATIALGLAPVLVSILGGHSRLIRLAALPCFWLGFLTLVAGMHGVCVVIYLFGDARQLYSFELARLDISPPIPPTSKRTHGSQKSSSTTPDDIEAQTRSNDKLTHALTTTIPILPHNVNPNSNNPSAPTTTSDSARSQYRSTQFDFDALTTPLNPLPQNAPSRPVRFRLVPTFGPLTAVLSPEITRAQWEITIRSAILGAVFAGALVGALMGIPSKHH